MKNSTTSRREFLKITSLLSLVGAASPFALNLAAMSSAIAQSSGSYRAIVYINLAGGNDSHNTVLATDPTSWASYVKYRDSSASDGALSIALPQTSLLPVTVSNSAGLNSGRTFALHPNLPKTQALMAAGRAAVVSNVGPLIAPLTAAQYQSGAVPVPRNLFSHNDQSSTWQAFAGEGAQFGWGGKMGDLLLSQNTGSVFTCISTGGNAVFLSGNSVTQLEVGAGGLPSLNGIVSNGKAASTVFPGFSGETADRTVADLNTILTQSRTDLMAQDIVDVTKRSIAAQAQFQQMLVPAYSATTPGGVAAPPSGNGLASQLQTVLRIMASAFALGVTRQVFYVSMGGFDTHANEVVSHQALMSTLDDAFSYFDTTATGLGLGNSATLFTGSEFGRTFVTNGSGSDHGWGAHHFVVGGAVKGGDVYGRFPTLGINNSDNVGSALLPNYSVDQYAATLATWMGVSSSNLAQLFPNLQNFAAPNLGFMST